jgi:signal transduction histidine kinase
VTIRHKLSLSALLLIMAFVAVAGVAAYIFRAIQQERAAISAANQIIFSIFELSLLGYEYQAYREERAIEQWQDVHRRLGQRLQGLDADTGLLAQTAVLQRLRDNHTLVGMLFAQLVAAQASAETSRLLSQSLLLRSHLLVSDAHRLAALRNQALAERTRRLLLLLSGALVPLALVCTFVFLVNRRLLQSLTLLHQGAEAIGKGELTYHFPIAGRDEFAALAGTMNAMMEQLYTLYQERADNEKALRRLAVNLERSNTDLEQFAYVASHDLQEPLRAVAGCVQLLQQRYTGHLDAHADELMAHAVDGAGRMRMLITDLLDYSRVTTRGRPLEPIDCNAVLAQALANLQVAMRESGALVTSDPLPTVPADATQLQQVFQNLLSNALKFRSQAPPTIHIGVECQAGDWQFSVRDNGIGLEPQYAERIFVIFQRLHTRREYAGTGIGLALCKKIVERHGGQIWVRSEPGQGATFYFTLPNASARSASA